jgi:glycosyltransferase involved in cell wall biosynthesis
MATAEALACGTPVVGTDVGATGELLNGAAGTALVRPEDPAALADAVGRLARTARTDPGIRTLCRTYACERYDWSKVINRWDAAIMTVAIDGNA